MDNKTACDHHADYHNIVCKVGKFYSFCVQTNSLHHCKCQNRFDTDINIDTGSVLYTTENDNSQRGECTAGEIQEPQTVHAAGPSHVLAVLPCAVGRDLCETKLLHYSTHLYCRSRKNYNPQTAEVDKKMVTEHQQRAMLTNPNYIK